MLKYGCNETHCIRFNTEYTNQNEDYEKAFFCTIDRVELQLEQLSQRLDPSRSHLLQARI
jgi:hypothetical protein